MAGIVETRDQREVLQCSLMGDSSVLHLIPVPGGDDVVHRGRWWVRGGAEGLSHGVGPCLGEGQPVSDVELRQQAVLHHLVQVVCRGAPQAAAEHRSIQGGVLVNRWSRDQRLTEFAGE